MSRGRQYTEDDKAQVLVVLRSNQGNAKKTSRDTGVPLSTIRAWAGLREREGKHAADVDPKKLEVAGNDLADKWRRVADNSLEVIEEYLGRLRGAEKVKAGDVRDLSVVAGVATEKESFARGGPNTRTASLHVSLVAPDVLRNNTLQVLERTDSGQVRTVLALPPTGVGTE